MTGVGALATDTYVSSLPQVQRTLPTTAALAQLTMTAFIAGSAAGQLLSGPISDARGRRRMVIVSCVVFTVTSLLCMLAGSGLLLVADRAVQGLAAGVGTAVGRAMVTDSYERRRAALVFGTMASVSLLGPVIAPGIGASLLAFGSWRVVFLFLAVIGVVMTLMSVLGLPETLPAQARHGGGLRLTWLRVQDLIADPAFRGPVLIQCLLTAGFFVYIGGSSFVLQSQLHFSPRRYALLFTTNAVVMVSAAVIFRLTVDRFGPHLLRRLGIAISATAIFLLLAAALLSPGFQPPAALVWILLAGMVGPMGFSIAGTTVIALEAGRRAPGAASSLAGGLPFLAGAAATPLTGLLGQQTVLTLAGCSSALFALAILTYWRYRRVRPAPAAVGVVSPDPADPAARPPQRPPAR
ncbi:MAG TPA: multidrug effflux MFS transporter [Jatrophihabitans sp.]|nr:multidrug effflux MFS transporter [Jatrophihabitans sp.]